ncbi:uncharacterized protein LOC133183785 [Saccostrea echinata]|uniref:uncharacterized protein LOC133183785 n=1 Tax=Saccostrea echinata TaxID=191078 RepID=UPI002A7EF9FF|nr:uncharacterized protein LOC133183785 [Saccostrea echinata]
MEKLGKSTFEQRLRSNLLQYLSVTNTRTMTPVRQNILQILIFLYGKETANKSTGFSYSEKKEVADQQKKYVLYAYLFMEALKSRTVTATDLSTLNRMWTNHLLYLVKDGKEKAAQNYVRILEDSDETVFNIKRFQRQLQKTRAVLSKNKDCKSQELVSSFCFRKPSFVERMSMNLRKLFGQRDPDDFFMLKFQDVN